MCDALATVGGEIAPHIKYLCGKLRFWTRRAQKVNERTSERHLRSFLAPFRSYGSFTFSFFSNNGGHRRNYVSGVVELEKFWREGPNAF